MNEAISSFLSQRIAANDFPSAVYLVAEKGEIVYHAALGNAVVEPEVIPAKLDTIYDVASLTKVLVTGLLTAILIDRGRLNLDDNAAAIISETSESSGKTVLELADHTSGQSAWLPFYLLEGAPEAQSYRYGMSCEANDIIHDFVLDFVLAAAPESKDRTNVTYSDINFLLLGFLVERLFGSDLHLVFQEQIMCKLGLDQTDFDIDGPVEIAASEMGNLYEKDVVIQNFPDLTVKESSFRSGPILGHVHDGNAYFMGGVAGHAGLFSTAEEVFKIALQFLPQYTSLLKPETCELFRTNFTPGMNEDRSFAFQLASTEGSTAGTTMSPESFGHNGFTGTSLWIDPIKDRIFVLLTNRTHAHPLPFVNINSVRRKFHDIAIAELDKRQKISRQK